MRNYLSKVLPLRRKTLSAFMAKKVTQLLSIKIAAICIEENNLPSPEMHTHLEQKRFGDMMI